MIKVIAFDVFGTVFNMKGVADKRDIKAYLAHIQKPEWSPLILPSYWEMLPAHPDAAVGIERLRMGYTVVTCSNGPLGMLSKVSKHNHISWDAIIPLELNKVFKPNPRAYMTVCEVLNVAASEVMMVTANKDFGDLEASAALGMTPMLIREEGKVKDIIELARSFGL